MTVGMSRAPVNLRQRADDRARETRIDGLYLKLHSARTPEERRRHLKAMEAEIAARSAEQVARMEREQGLR